MALSPAVASLVTIIDETAMASGSEDMAASTWLDEPESAVRSRNTNDKTQL